MLFDTHAHVNFSGFKDDADVVMQLALDNEVVVINVGTQLDTSKSAIAMSEKYEKNVYAVIGIHPVHTYQQMLDEEESHFKTRAEKFEHDVYYKLGQNAKVVGIGECGLDYYRLPQGTNYEAGSMSQEEIKQLQKDAFVGQIRLARELNKALVIHCRPSKGTQDAYEDILKILDEEFSRFKILDSAFQLRFEIHSFTGSPDIVQEFLKRGAYVGVNGIITFDKTGNMEQIVKTVPLDRIVLETDCPYLTPAPNRGKRNEPSYVKFVAEKIALVKQISVHEVADTTSQNAKLLFIL